MTAAQLNAKKATFRYLLDSINEGLGTTDKDKINGFFSAYNAEFNHDYNRRRYPVESERLGQYLQGLPSSIDIDFSDLGILNRGRELGYKIDSPAKERKFISNWFNVCGIRLLQLREQLNRA